MIPDHSLAPINECVIEGAAPAGAKLIPTKRIVAMKDQFNSRSRRKHPIINSIQPMLVLLISRMAFWVLFINTTCLGLQALRIGHWLSIVVTILIIGCQMVQRSIPSIGIVQYCRTDLRNASS